MLKKAIVCAMLLGAAMGGAQAAEQTWTFTYTGFEAFERTWNTEAVGVFKPTKTFITEFTGDDIDGDGTIELSELSKLSIGGDNALACDAETSNCTTTFSFGPNNTLDYSHQSTWWGEYTHHEFWARSGEEFGVRFTASGTLQSEGIYKWTPATRLDVLAPVPEPTEWAMYGAGLAVLAGVCRRRRKTVAAALAA